MKIKQANIVPVYITVVVLAFVIWLHLNSRRSAEKPEVESGSSTKKESPLVESIEWLTYDMRVRLGARLNDVSTVPQNLGTVFIDDEALKRLNRGWYSPQLAPAASEERAAALHPAPPLPRFIHGQLVRELSNQGATAIAFDIFFADLFETNQLHSVFDPVEGWVSSDDFFARELRRASNVILALEKDLPPADLFRTNTFAVGSAVSDPDKGVVRRVRPYQEFRVWHPLIRSQERTMGLQLGKASTNQPGKLILPLEPTPWDADPAPWGIPLNPNGTLKLTKDLELDVGDDPDDEGPMTERPFETIRAWNLGLTLAAKAIGLDLNRAEVLPGKIILRGPSGLKREIPTDSAGFFQIDWSLRFEDLRQKGSPVYAGQLGELLILDDGRTKGDTNIVPKFKNRLVLIGSTATGNNMTDIGATPLEPQTFLVTKHLNIASSILNGRFIRRTSPFTEGVLIAALGLISALLTWRMRVLAASMAILGLCLCYTVFTGWMYLDYRYWVPLVMPLAGGLLAPHVALVTYRVIFEQREQRRVRGIFSKIVAPDVVRELLSAEHLSLGGVRRKLTVFFADVRGFTEFTDSSQESAIEYVRGKELNDVESSAHFDKVAAEQLATVNLYLATIADRVKEHQGTLDKYMGDCVMAFWGAPVANERHALYCVRAAIDAQRALANLNQQRFAENESRKAENVSRAAEGKPPLPLLALLSLGTGINTGFATVGLMGSDATISNYTVFGREVNLASRLEGVSGRGRIVVSEATYLDLLRDDPTLAATCIAQAPVTPKGFRQPIKTYEVPWKIPKPATITQSPEPKPAETKTVPAKPTESPGTRTAPAPATSAGL